jgi:hypothetical protein
MAFWYVMGRFSGVKPAFDATRSERTNQATNNGRIVIAKLIRRKPLFRALPRQHGSAVGNSLVVPTERYEYLHSWF